MRLRSTGVALSAAAAFLVAATGVGAALVPVYRNGMESDGQRGEMLKLSGARCNRGGSDHALRVVVGKKTRECSYRTPVIGRDLEIAATMRLLSQTPKSARGKSFLSLNLRSGDGGHYQLLVFPLQGKAQLRKVLPGGKVEFLHVAKHVAAIKGVDEANKVRLRAFNVTSGKDKGSCRLLAWVGKEKVAEVTDGAAGELKGRASGFAFGATKGAKGVAGSVDNVVIRVPNPA